MSRTILDAIAHRIVAILMPRANRHVARVGLRMACGLPDLGYRAEPAHARTLACELTGDLPSLPPGPLDWDREDAHMHVATVGARPATVGERWPHAYDTGATHVADTYIGEGKV